MVVITGALWVGMGFIGYMAGLFIGGRYAAYIGAIVFTALGAYISRVIAKHSFVNYTPRRKMPVQEESYVSGDYFTPQAYLREVYAQITIMQENGDHASTAYWEFFLDGEKAGRAAGNSPVTFPTGRKDNVLVARNDKGVLSPPFEFSVKSGRHAEVLFRGDRFEGVKDIGRMAFDGQGKPSAAKH